MIKVFSENECWYVDELTDIYYFKSVSNLTGQENYEILSWTRMSNLENNTKKPIRMYDIEFDGKKYYFLLLQYGDKWKIEAENNWEIDELCKEKNITLIGEIKI